MATSVDVNLKARGEKWLGRMAPGSDLETRFAERLNYWEVPELVALEELMADRATMVRHSATHSADNVRSGHAKNLDEIPVWIAELAAAIEGDETIVLSVAGASLVASAKASGGDDGGSVDLIVDNRRRG